MQRRLGFRLLLGQALALGLGFVAAFRKEPLALDVFQQVPPAVELGPERRRPEAQLLGDGMDQEPIAVRRYAFPASSSASLP